MVETRRLYRFEDVFSMALPEFTRRGCTLTTLRELAAKVWARYGRKGLPVPSITFGPGIPHGNYRASWAEGYSKIELMPGQRNRMVLLHELTHTLGHSTHGKGFVRKYIRLLTEFAQCDESVVRQGMKSFNIKS